MEKVEERFIRYAKIGTQSDPENEQCPSTEKQWKLAKLLAEELENLSFGDVTLDEHAYVMATLPANTKKDRSEEHTSELQSHSFISYAVFCLKKKKYNNHLLLL